MRVVVVELAQLVVSFEEAARHLRLDGDEERQYVEALIAAAQGHIDGPAGWLGRSIGVQTLELRMDAWPSCLPYRPVIDIVSVRVDGEEIDGVSVEMDGLLNMPPRLPRPTQEVVIRYRSGYGRWQGEGDDRQLVGDAPAPIKQAMLLLIGQWYASRENVVTGTIATELPMAANALLAPYRVWSI